MSPFKVAKLIVPPFQYSKNNWHCEICEKQLKRETKYSFIHKSNNMGRTCLNERCIQMFILQRM
jgi:hypothetical protein